MKRFVCADFSLSLDSPSLAVRTLPSFWCGEDTFHMAVLGPAFRNKKEGQSAFYASAISQCVKIAYFGMTEI